MSSEDMWWINRIELEKLEQEALIEAANLVAQNPHIDFNIQKELILKDKLEKVKKQKIEEKKFKEKLEKVQEEIYEEIKRWEEEDRVKEKERKKKISSILSKVEDSRILQIVQNEIANREEQIKQEQKSHFTSLVALLNMEQQSEEDVKKIYTVMPEDFEKLTAKRKNMLDKLEIKVEKFVKDEPGLKLEKFDESPIIDQKDRTRIESSKDMKKQAIGKKYETCVKRYEETFYYQGRTSKSKSGNIIKAKDVVRKEFKDALQCSIDHKKALEEATKKAEEKKKEILAKYL